MFREMGKEGRITYYHRPPPDPLHLQPQPQVPLGPLLQLRPLPPLRRLVLPPPLLRLRRLPPPHPQAALPCVSSALKPRFHPQIPRRHQSPQARNRYIWYAALGWAELGEEGRRKEHVLLFLLAVVGIERLELLHRLLAGFLLTLSGGHCSRDACYGGGGDGEGL